MSVAASPELTLQWRSASACGAAREALESVWAARAFSYAALEPRMAQVAEVGALVLASAPLASGLANGCSKRSYLCLGRAAAVGALLWTWGLRAESPSVQKSCAMEPLPG
jgi:hypothetical protein